MYASPLPLPPQRGCAFSCSTAFSRVRLKYTCYTRPDSLSVPGSPFSILPAPELAPCQLPRQADQLLHGMELGQGKDQTGVGDGALMDRVAAHPGRKGPSSSFPNLKTPHRQFLQLPSDPRTVSRLLARFLCSTQTAPRRQPPAGLR